MLSEAFTKTVINTILGEEERNLTSLDDMECSLISELGNIMCGSYIRALSQLMDMDMDVSVPELCIDMGGAILTYPCPTKAGRVSPVKACYDLNHETAQKVAEEWGIPHVAETVEELVEFGKQYDAVFDIAVPANAIPEILVQLPDNAGVLIQKPMGESIEQAREILRICHEKNLTAGINFQLRQAPYMIAVRDLINRGVIGEVVDIDHRLVGEQPWNLWPFLFPKDRVEINYHSIHYIDNIRSLVGDPKSVYCKTMQHPKMRDLAQTRTAIIMDYGDDLRVNLHINFNHNYAKKYQESILKIEGLEGAIRVKLGLMYDYPEGEPDRVEYITFDEGE